MTYSPNNTEIYLAAFSGAIAGMGVSDRVPTNIDSNSPVNEGIINVAGAFAQSFDTQRNNVLATPFEVETTRELCETAWQDRAPQPNATNLNSATFNALSNALLALLRAAGNYLNNQNISNNGLPVTRLNAGTGVGQTIANNTPTAIQFTTAQYDTNDMFNNTTPTKIIFNTPGIYRVTGQIAYASFGGDYNLGNRTITIRKNGTLNIAYENFGAPQDAIAAQNVSVEDEFDSGDYVELIIIQSSGAPLDIFVADPISPTFSASFVRPPTA